MYVSGAGEPAAWPHPRRDVLAWRCEWIRWMKRLDDCDCCYHGFDEEWYRVLAIVVVVGGSS
jgi:hypothetical protein